jgi:hypothetical protein
MRNQSFILHRRDDDVTFGADVTFPWGGRGEVVFFQDYTAVGDGMFDTKMGLDFKQMDLVMEWWQNERLNYIPEEN